MALVQSPRPYDGHDNTATAVGTDSSAAAYGGSDNTAVADGDGAIAAAFGGDHNSATASGDDAFAVAQLSDRMHRDQRVLPVTVGRSSPERSPLGPTRTAGSDVI